jgi:crotonobetainyl-CoA:carnitine CoA-transferase CaiB-like acyl-CoA transferase
MPHHRNGVLAMFGVPNDRAAVARAVARHDAAELEAELQALGTCAAMARSELDWMAHPAGLALAELPLLEIERIGDGPRSSGAVARPPAAGRPADGVRVLDMSRVIAGPVCGRTLAGYGADVLRVGAAHLTDSRTLVIDTGLGKRSTFLNLRVAADARRMRELVATADVVVQAYRPRALDRLGFGPDELARLRPGIVCATISAYGRLGPWSGLRGFDGLVQTASGIAVAAAAASDSDRPLPLPAAALDHATGYLAAYGVLAALARRHVEGGSWQVRLSLAQTGRWLVGLGEHDTLAGADPTPAEQAGLRRTMHTEFGEISYIAPPGEVAGISPAYDTPPSSLGAHEAAWVTTTP